MNTINYREKVLVNKHDVSVREISVELGKQIIMKNHYTHKWSYSTVVLGVFLNGHSEPVGVLVYGPPVGKSVAGGMFSEQEIPINDRDNVFVPSNKSIHELKRMWIKDGLGFNIESVWLAKSFRWLKENREEIKVLVSYSDPSEGHRGTIYQSTNWFFQPDYDNENPNDFYVSRVIPEKSIPNDWKHSRTLGHIYGGSSLDTLRRKIGRTFWIKKNVRKYRYLYFLCNGKEQERLVERLSHPITRNYPKKVLPRPPIQEVRVFTE